MYQQVKKDDIEFNTTLQYKEVDPNDIEQTDPEETYSTWQNMYMNARPYLQTALEGGGSIAGTIAGTAVGKPLTGDALGYAVGAEALDALDVSFGIKGSGTLGEEFAELGRNIQSGYTQGMGGQILGKTVQAGIGAMKSGASRLTNAVRRGVSRYKAERAPMFSPIRDPSVRKAAGRALSETRPNSAMAMANRYEAEAMQETMPGLNYTRAQKLGTPSSLVLEDSLIRSGVKMQTAKSLMSGEALSQVQKQEAQDAILKYYSDKVDTGSIKNFMDTVFIGKNKLEMASTTAEKQARKSVFELGAKTDDYDIGKQLSETVSTKKRKSLQRATELYDEVPNIALRTKTLKKDIDDYVLNEDNLLEPRTTKLVKLLKEHIDERPLVGFKTLRKIRTRVNRYIKATGSNPEDARQLKKVKEIINTALDAGFSSKYEFTPKMGMKVKEANRDLLSSLVSAKKLGEGSWYRGTNIRELEHVIDKGKLVIGESYEGASGISAYQVKSGAPITMQGSYTSMPVTIIGVKNQLEGVGQGVNEVLVNPATNPKQLLYGINGKIYNYDEMVDFTKNYKALSSVDEKAAAKYKKASSYYREHARKYKEGITADILEKGKHGEPSNIPYSKVGKKIFTKEGIEAYTEIAGRDVKAMNTLKTYVKKHFYDNAYDPIKDTLKPTSAFNWVNKHIDTLKRLGMKDDMYKVARKIKESQVTVKELKDFVKPGNISGKIVASGPDEMVSNVFKSSKNITDTAKQMKALINNQPKAIQGLQRAVSKRIMDGSKVTAEGFTDDFRISFPRLDTQYKKYMPVLKEVYANAPKKLQALVNVHKAFKILHRDASSLVSDRMSPYSMLTNLAKIGGAGSLKFPVVFAFKKITEKYSNSQINKLLLRASFDPDFATGLEYLFKSKGTKESLKKFDGLMSRLTAYSIKRLQGDSDE